VELSLTRELSIRVGEGPRQTVVDVDRGGLHRSDSHGGVRGSREGACRIHTEALEVAGKGRVGFISTYHSNGALLKHDTIIDEKK
jgi:hypothetical protein